MAPAPPPEPADSASSRPEPRPGTPLFPAFERLGWARRTLEDLTRPGPGHDIERLERHFARMLQSFRAVEAALLGAAEAAGPVAAAWADAHRHVVATDPLLHYLLNAPDLDPEDGERPTLLTWAPDIQAFELRVVDARRAARFFDEGALVRHLFRCETDAQLFRKVADGVMPSLRRLHKAGAEMLSRYEVLHLRPYGDASVPAHHAGRPLEPTAAAALDAATGWFERAADELAAVIG